MALESVSLDWVHGYIMKPCVVCTSWSLLALGTIVTKTTLLWAQTFGSHSHVCLFLCLSLSLPLSPLTLCLSLSLCVVSVSCGGAPALFCILILSAVADRCPLLISGTASCWLTGPHSAFLLAPLLSSPLCSPPFFSPPLLRG